MASPPPSAPPARLVVLVSGSGTNLQALLDAAEADPEGFGARVVAVGADRDDIAGLERAEHAGLPTFVCRVKDYASRDAWDRALAEATAAHEPDLVVSAGFMKIVGEEFLARFGGRCVNTHPALLPSFPGAHGVRDALAYGAKVTGCTVHFVDKGVDTGPVIAQGVVEIRDEDDEAALHERIKEVERGLLVEVVGRLARHGHRIEGRKVMIPVTVEAADTTDATGAAAAAETAVTTAGAEKRAVRRALVSVYDKTGLEELARGLHQAGVELVSTGSTAGKIAAAGVPVTKVEELTGFPECLDGRVKTLHPRVHAGILADLRLESHREQLAELGVEPFDLVIVNLYPFRETVASGASPDECVEQIDIGGPSMVRAAAKNHPSVAVVTSPERYADVLTAVQEGGFDLGARKRLAAEAFQHTAAYDVAVASWFASSYAPADASGFPDFTGSAYRRSHVLRYGENPHQGAALYVDGSGGLAEAEQLHGKGMSYNNYTDTEAARRAAYDQSEPCVAIIKHANPCGIAVGADVAEAHRKAHACDPLSAFGGVIAVNRPVSVAMAEQVAEIFTEVVVAPAYEDGAVEVLARKKNIRVLRCPEAPSAEAEVKPIDGGALVQVTDRLQAEGDDPESWTLATGDALDAAGLAELAFAWRACRAVKSNAILLAKDGASVGVGMGQVNRVDSAKLAVERAGEERARGSYAASDAFFPFPDGLEILTAAGVRAVVQPGGSMRDELVIEAAKKAGVTMYLTGTRHFFH